MEPISYKKINGPLPVEWESEVFEKYENPYKREGAGLTLAFIYLDEGGTDKNILLNLLKPALSALDVFRSDSIEREIGSYHNFYLSNRLFLLNLATIYSTGFECPSPERVIPELRIMLRQMQETYITYNQCYPGQRLTDPYLELFAQVVQFTEIQSEDYETFDHFSFVRNYINPLFRLNQEMIRSYRITSKSLGDYTLNKQSTSIFSKHLYAGQNPKGIYLHVTDTHDLQALNELGRLLFYDPILSLNNERSCASCHVPGEYFTDTLNTSAIQFDKSRRLERNTPSLLEVQYNHLVMQDGKHFTLQNQGKAVITNPAEMGSDPDKIVTKVLSCKTYKKTFSSLLKYTPQEKEITFDHIVSAITYYYCQFSGHDAPFDKLMNLEATDADNEVQNGFNVFMGKAQCGTCHFAPQFNGVKPPYIGSEFEVLGVPSDTLYTSLSKDNGRFEVNPADETLNAFRTPTLRNVSLTKPYMHNGVFASMEQVIEFYNNGGGTGHGLTVPNQTLSGDSLHLTPEEKRSLTYFLRSLNEEIPPANPPATLPSSTSKALNTRKAGGTY